MWINEYNKKLSKQCTAKLAIGGTGHRQSDLTKDKYIDGPRTARPQPTSLLLATCLFSLQSQDHVVMFQVTGMAYRLDVVVWQGVCKDADANGCYRKYVCMPEHAGGQGLSFDVTSTSPSSS